MVKSMVELMVKQVTEPVAGNYFPINSQILIQVPSAKPQTPNPWPEP